MNLKKNLLEELQKTLNLPEGLVEFNLKLKVDSLAVVECTFYPNQESTDAAIEIIKKYLLVEIQEPKS